MDLPAALAEGRIGACNVARNAEYGYQVSTLRPGTGGWQVFFGPDLFETIQRAVDGGTQLPEGYEPDILEVEEDDWSHLV